MKTIQLDLVNGQYLPSENMGRYDNNEIVCFLVNDNSPADAVLNNYGRTPFQIVNQNFENIGLDEMQENSTFFCRLDTVNQLAVLFSGGGGQASFQSAMIDPTTQTNIGGNPSTYIINGNTIDVDVSSGVSGSSDIFQIIPPTLQTGQRQFSLSTQVIGQSYNIGIAKGAEGESLEDVVSRVINLGAPEADLLTFIIQVATGNANLIELSPTLNTNVVPATNITGDSIVTIDFDAETVSLDYDDDGTPENITIPLDDTGENAPMFLILTHSNIVNSVESLTLNTNISPATAWGS